jgi:hypothetical protein
MIRRALRAQGLLRHAERHSMAAASNKPRVVQHNPKLVPIGMQTRPNHFEHVW